MVSLRKNPNKNNIFLKIQKRNNVPLIITEQNRVNGHRLKEQTNPVQTGHYDERT